MTESDALKHKQAILDYWTLVEFFSPYILENSLDQNQNHQTIYADDLLNQLLPWSDAPTIDEDDSTTPFAKGYRLYLGLFNFEETADRARHVFAKSPSQWQSINWRNCIAAGSTTCFAGLTVTTHGIPLLGTLSLSTLPWAHGHLLNGEEELLTIEQYSKSVNRLLLNLRAEFIAQLPLKLMKRPKNSAGYLNIEALSKLMNILYEWAGYKPKGYPLALIESISGDNRVAAKDPQIKTGRDIPILNSFYIQDLESVATSLTTQQGKPIDHYLGSDDRNRIQLESEEGIQAILNMIRPEKTPSGRWPDALSHQQSLMQQFAINAAFDLSDRKAIFSINGPPGTGKTSLLREIIAENIVARAEALSQFDVATQAFVGKQALNFENNDLVMVSELHPSILGHEMLFVSSNNTAVQNLSKELPLRSQLDPSFHNASYLESVATKVLGLKEKESWGLISATLGNMENCRHFVESVFMTRNEAKCETRIWEWIDEYSGPSFCEAKDAFIKTKNRQAQLFDELDTLIFLHEEIGNHTIETYCAKAFEGLESAENTVNNIDTKISQLLQEEVDAKELLKLLLEKEMLLKEERPNPLARIMNRQASKKWSQKSNAFRKERIDAIEEIQKCKIQLKEWRNRQTQQDHIVNDCEIQFLQQALLFHTYSEAYHKLKKIHCTAHLPKNAKELENQDAHTQSYYQTTEGNAIRSELFIAAMTLHEAWLAETSRIKGGFRGNLMAIAQILQGKSPTTADDTKLAWQSAFLLLPVISSTFASIGRLFRHLEPGAIGWLLIDEAGQAIPQAAAGAIWRAQRVISIGDPFQIEPICTTPAEVLDGMAKIKIKDHTLNWAPSQVSVQNLMDRASLFGSKRTVHEEDYWLGSPLRVHRRCQEPMFTIANTIAYEQSMLLATAPDSENSLPPSCWWDVGGHASNKQFIVEQGEALIQLLMDAFVNMSIPDLYVISPFREVVLQIQKLVTETKAFKEFFVQKFPGLPLLQWVRQSIGTVHTFQGKQATAVFFVLGAEKSCLGAVEWASRKPNLLNVAVTRAKSRFYIIGDYNLWKSWPYFNVAAKKLERRIYTKGKN